MTSRRIPLEIISGDQTLAAFREGLTGPAALEQLEAAGGRLLNSLPVGVGKSSWIIKIITHVFEVVAHDFVLLLVPRWDILNELKAKIPKKLKPLVLHPRPRKRCGQLDTSWVDLERTGCSLLGRQELCGNCPRRTKCNWPDQCDDQLRGRKLILSTQQRLINDPGFVSRLTQATGAKNPLVLLDESTLLVRPMERIISKTELGRFVDALRIVENTGGANASHAKEWLQTTVILQAATSADVRSNGWRFPIIHAKWAVAVQRIGRELFGPDFRFLAHDLRAFAASDVASRDKSASGDLQYAAIPSLGRKFIVFSGSMAKSLARYRLDPNFAQPAISSPFERYQFRHPDTRFYNLNHGSGAAKYFRGKNSDRIMDFFAALIARNIVSGVRTLLISKKKFIGLCKVGLTKRLAQLNVAPFQIVTENWDKHDLTNPRTISLIHYGVAGINRFEHIEAAYCLNSYYVTKDAVSAAVQDIEPESERFDMEIRTCGNPKRREVIVHVPPDRSPITKQVATEVHTQIEGDTIVQAIGRVRPFTKARDVFTFHCGELPGIKYDFEFSSLDAARQFFGVRTPATVRRDDRLEAVRELHLAGRSCSEIARIIGCGLSTVKRDRRKLRERGEIA